MRAIETIMDVKDNGEFFLHFPREVGGGPNSLDHFFEKSR